MSEVQRAGDDQDERGQPHPVTSSGSNGSTSANKEHQCPICLHVWHDPTVLDHCSHVFCFACILEWTRVKPECPLCKSGLEELKHELQLHNDAKPSWRCEGKIESIIELRSAYEFDEILARTSYAPDVEKHALIQQVRAMLGELGTLRKCCTLTSRTSESAYGSAIASLEEDLKQYKELLLTKFKGGSTRAQLFAEPAFRRLVYAQNLQPRSICPSMCDVVFNMDHIRAHRDAVRMQLIPYVIRELAAITGRACVDIDVHMAKLLDYLSGRLPRLDMVLFLNARGVQNPHHFLNNLAHFASAGQTLEVYDQNSEYTPRRTNYTGALFPDDDDVLVLNSNTDIEVVGERPGTTRRQSPLNGEARTAATSSAAQIPSQRPQCSSALDDRVLDLMRQHPYFFQPPMLGSQMNQSREAPPTNGHQSRRRGLQPQGKEASSITLDDDEELLRRHLDVRTPPDDSIEFVTEIKKRRRPSDAETVSSDDAMDEGA